MSLPRLIALSWVLSGLSGAQVPDANFWSFRAGVAASTLEVHDATLSQVVSFSLLGFPSVAKSGDGTVWVTSSGALTPYVGLAPGAPAVASGVLFVAAFPGGGLWTLEGPSVVLRDTQGAALQSWMHGLSSLPRFLVPDALGGVWIFDSPIVNAAGQITPGQLVRLDPSGNLSSPLSPTGGQPFDAVPDRQGRVWVLTSDTTVEVYSSVGGLVVTLSPPGTLRALSIDPIGRPRVLAISPGSSALHTLDLAGLRSTLALPPAPNSYGGWWERARCDHLGRTWLVDGNQNLQILDRDGIPGSSLTGGAGPYWGGNEYIGDQTTVALTGILLHGADSDGDGFSNDTEIRSGSDALDATSTPSMLQATPMVAGQVGAFNLLAPTEPGAAFVLAASEGTAGFTLSELNPLTVPLTPDPLFDLWLSPSNVFVTPGVVGALDATGAATLSFAPPLGSAGISFFASAVTVDPSVPRLGSITPVISITIL